MKQLRLVKYIMVLACILTTMNLATSKASAAPRPLRTWYQDADGDGFGNPSVSRRASRRPLGYVQNHRDCNEDADAAIRPGRVTNLVTSSMYTNFQSAVDAATNGEDLFACHLSDKIGIILENKNLEIFGEDSAIVGANTGIQLINSTSRIDGLDVTDSTAGGIVVDETSYLQFSEGLILRNTADVGGGANVVGEVYFTDTQFDDNSSSTAGDAIYLAATGNVRVDGYLYNHITNGAIYMELGTSNTLTMESVAMYTNTPDITLSNGLSYTYNSSAVSVTCSAVTGDCR